ncbi:hypothetical protein Agub_g13335 [Astrephomene gubernaculifera]|uniref:Poly(A) RNA polymerase mitochondrial-like central palm domain-containing protein n=1 Tax=Astrephomene gubernaculifera TaxID=47775 RepID=A0AAD3E298_9CHLO|nr:hypothetical protein Agub_g13335 [Astrephomene gubernaculifera]
MQCTIIALRQRIRSLCTLQHDSLLRCSYQLRHQTSYARVAGLEHALDLVATASAPSQDDHDKRVRLIKDIHESLQRLDRAENLRIVPFGSFVSSFYDSKSDLDLAVCGSVPPPTRRDEEKLRDDRRSESQRDVGIPLHKLHRAERSKLLRGVANQLLADGIAAPDSTIFLLHARVPLIKFTDQRSGIAVDLCLGSDDVAFKAWSVAQVASINPAFGKLFRVVKVWAKAHAINDGAAHMFNSWCLTLVVMFFLQRHPQHRPLLPPLHALLHDEVPEVETPRMMQKGVAMSAMRCRKVMACMTRRVVAAREVYGERPCQPLDELFADFVEDGGRMLRGLLAGEEPFKRGVRISAFYGDFRDQRPYDKAYYIFVDDPYDSSDNTARTLRRPGRTMEYILSVFERTARRLGRDVRPSTQASSSEEAVNTASSGGNERTSPADADLAMTSSGASTSASELPGLPSASPTSAPPSPPSSFSSSASPPSLAATLAFLFGPELLSRLPHLSPQLLGPQLDEWARAGIRAGRPAGEVHEVMLRLLGAEGDFESFDSFKRRHKIKVFNEDKYATPEEKEAAAALEEERQAAKREKMEARRERLAARREKFLREREERAAKRNQLQHEQANADKAVLSEAELAEEEAQRQSQAVVASILAAAAEARQQVVADVSEPLLAPPPPPPEQQRHAVECTHLSHPSPELQGPQLDERVVEVHETIMPQQLEAAEDVVSSGFKSSTPPGGASSKVDSSKPRQGVKALTDTKQPSPKEKEAAAALEEERRERTRAKLAAKKRLKRLQSTGNKPVASGTEQAAHRVAASEAGKKVVPEAMKPRVAPSPSRRQQQRQAVEDTSAGTKRKTSAVA